MGEKSINKFIIPIVAISIFAVILFGAGYAYFTAATSMNTANYQITMPVQTSLVCTKQDCGLTITPSQMTNGNTNSTNEKANNTCYVECTCSGSEGAVCNYNLTILANGTPYTPSAGLGTNKEFTATVYSPSGCTASNSSSTETQVDVLDGKIVSRCSLTVPAGGSVTVNSSVEFKWYNLNINQASHAGQSYKYDFTTDDSLAGSYSGNIYQEGYLGFSYYSLGDNITAYDYDYSTDTPNGDYIKFTVANNVITAAYACIYTNNHEYCIQGGDPSYYGSYTGMSSTSVSSVSGATGNIAQLKALQDATSGTAWYNSSESAATGGSYGLYAYSDGSAESCYGAHCNHISVGGSIAFWD